MSSFIKSAAKEHAVLAVERGRRVLSPPLRPPECPANLLFVTVSGAHLYGFPSADSDIDLRGAHVLPLPAVVGLKPTDKTAELKNLTVDGMEVDCVSHDVEKYLRLLTRNNGYVLEQIFSPLVVHDGGRLDRLRALARGAMTRHLVHHYKGFFATQEKLALKLPSPTAKAVLYMFRVVMTGLHLLRTGEEEANLQRLNESAFHLDCVSDLVFRKMTGAEKGLLPPSVFEPAYAQIKALEARFDSAFKNSVLPDKAKNYEELHDFLVDIRLSGLNAKR